MFLLGDGVGLGIPWPDELRDEGRDRFLGREKGRRREVPAKGVGCRFMGVGWGGGGELEKFNAQG